MFESLTAGDTATAVLAAIGDARAQEDAAAADVLRLAAEWADLHPAESIRDAAVWARTTLDGRERALPLAGDGAPLVAEFCVAELGAALRMPTGSARALLAEALELRHRLPRVWARVLAHRLPAWRARRIARETSGLSLEAAEFVDRQIAPFAHKVGPAETDRLIADAVARFMPDHAEHQRQAAADRRHVHVGADTVSFDGTTWISGELDLADALDLDTALNLRAAALVDAGCEGSFDVRRSVALGELARGDDALDGVTVTREVVLHVHVHEESDVARLDTGGRHLVTTEQVRAWCGGAAAVTVRPVVDLTGAIHVDQYEIPRRLDEMIEERDVTCVFPWCTRTGRSCDDDHIVPYAEGGTTSDDNLAKLCRHHHRLKTHAGWTYTMIEPGTYLWRSPHGLQLLRGPTGSERLT